MGEPTCSGANPTSSFQCDPTAAGATVSPITTTTTCPEIAHTDVTLWSADKAACDKGPSKMNDMTCSNIQTGIGNVTVAECDKMKKIYSGCCKPQASGSTTTVLSALAGAAAALAGLVVA